MDRDPLDSSALRRAASLIAAASALTVLTGAGVSAESGVPTFRGPGGLWRNHRPEDLATPDAFARDPALVWEWYRSRRDGISAVAPNPGHQVVARLERRASSYLLVTQNVDGLHQRAGSTRLVEVHGNIFTTACPCGVSLDESPGPGHSRSPELDNHGVPRCPRCGGIMRPGVVWFGESLPHDAWAAAARAAAAGGVMLVIGTSALVHPAAGLPDLTRQAGGTIIEVNTDPTPLTSHADVVLRGTAGTVCPALEALL